ncbi:MAG TPA: ATPase [Magnetospirillum sp.]|nr:ATPase [Magnetospirillum sp.]
MTAHAPTVAFSGIDCLDVDVQAQAPAALVGFTVVKTITDGNRT